MKKHLPLIIVLIFGIGFFMVRTGELHREQSHAREKSQKEEHHEMLGEAQVQDEKNTETGSGHCVSHPQVRFFMYHSIRESSNTEQKTTQDLSVSPSLFERHMQKIASLAQEKKITLMRGDEFLESVETRCFPEKIIWIFTADDGWKDMHDTLVPLAKKYGVPFFVGIVWKFIGKEGFITREDVFNMANTPLITISSHSLDHIDNSKLGETQSKVQICESKNLLEQLTNKPIKTYIYPSGRFDEVLDPKILKECGYTLAWSTGFGKTDENMSGSLYDINRIRIRIHSTTPLEFFDTLITD